MRRLLEVPDAIESVRGFVRDGVTVDVDSLSSIVDRLLSDREADTSEPVRDLPELDLPILMCVDIN